MNKTIPFLALVAAAPAVAEGTRQLDAHEHGVGALNIAIEGANVAMEFHAPGADIVGFEYVAQRDEDRAAIASAISVLGAPLELFVLPEAAGCRVTEAEVDLEGDEGHADHHEHDHDEHDHDAHAEHEEGDNHTEFHAEYRLTCDDTAALTGMTFAFFDVFPNAREIEVQLLSSTGARAFEVDRNSPVLDFGSLN